MKSLNKNAVLSGEIRHWVAVANWNQIFEHGSTGGGRKVVFSLWGLLVRPCPGSVFILL